MNEHEKKFMEGWIIDRVGVSNMDTDTALNIANTCMSVLLEKMEKTGEEYGNLTSLHSRIEYAQKWLSDYARTR